MGELTGLNKLIVQAEKNVCDCRSILKKTMGTLSKLYTARRAVVKTVVKAFPENYGSGRLTTKTAKKCAKCGDFLGYDKNLGIFVCNGCAALYTPVFDTPRGGNPAPVSA